jgi:YD repeat-containing protein
MMSPLQSTTTRLPSGLTNTEQVRRTVTLSNPADLLSVATMTETTQLNGRQSTRVYNAATRTWTTTTPSGRISRTVLDQQGRPVRIELPGVVASELAYDAHGRLSTLRQGARVTGWTRDGWDCPGGLASAGSPWVSGGFLTYNRCHLAGVRASGGLGCAQRPVWQARRDRPAVGAVKATAPAGRR